MSIERLKLSADGLNLPNCNAEMSHEEQIFVQLLLRRYQPKKIVEIGVAAGGTSALILKNTSDEQRVYGIDANSVYYRDKSKSVGYVVDEICDDNEKKRYTLMRGIDPVDALPKIGSDVDFCILDTWHTMPAEMLQFFVLYKYMKKGACLVLHDINLNLLPGSNPLYNLAWCTKLLFSTAGSAIKIVPDIELPNIGAFIIDDETEKYLDSTFIALGISWHYYPEALMGKYRNFIKNNYTSSFANYFNIIQEKMPGRLL